MNNVPGNLPPGWEAKWSAQHNKYYYINHALKSTTWAKPQAPSPLISSGPVEKAALPSGWEAKWDNNTKRYYYIDHVNKKTSWVKPMEPAAQNLGPHQDNSVSSTGSSTYTDVTGSSSYTDVTGSSTSSSTCSSTVSSVSYKQKPFQQFLINPNSQDTDAAFGYTISELDAANDLNIPDSTPWKINHIKKFTEEAEFNQWSEHEIKDILFKEMNPSDINALVNGLADDIIIVTARSILYTEKKNREKQDALDQEALAAAILEQNMEKRKRNQEQKQEIVNIYESFAISESLDSVAARCISIDWEKLGRGELSNEALYICKNVCQRVMTKECLKVQKREAAEKEKERKRKEMEMKELEQKEVNKLQQVSSLRRRSTRKPVTYSVTKYGAVERLQVIGPSEKLVDRVEPKGPRVEICGPCVDLVQRLVPVGSNPSLLGSKICSVGQTIKVTSYKNKTISP